MKKRLIVILLCLCLALPLSAQCAVRVTVNNAPLTFDTAPKIENGRTLVPMRKIFEALGATVSWNDATKTAIGQKDGVTVSVPIGSTAAYVNGAAVTLDVAAKIEDDRTLVPLRFIAESFVCTVQWQAKTETAIITDGASRPVRPLSVHFVDVGQGDCILALLPNGEDLLIDAGNNKDGQAVVSYLRAQGVADLEYVIGTHAHADHIGGMDDVINALPAKSVYLPAQTSDTKTYKEVLTALQNKNITAITATAGVVLYDKNGLKLELLAPKDAKYKDLNDSSAVLKLTYINTVFLFMGDAEELSENQIAADVDADVLKIGHHGSNSSTSESFLSRVTPNYGVICVGAGNTYGHPTAATLQKLTARGIRVYRTDINGTVVFEADGDTISAPAA